MVDFKKRLAGKKAEKPVDPIKLYDTLDRAHDKGPLRPAQLSVLKSWFTNHLDDRDAIVKLHTGQGKTLIGLLMLQMQLNNGKGPALYLCPDNFLIDQTREQAKQFGIATCRADPELPDDFLNSDKILVTSVQKLFNGLTKFGLDRKSVSVGTLLMDDAHACADTIREACRIRIPSDEPAYDALQTLFADDLEQQGLGTYADICNDKARCVTAGSLLGLDRARSRSSRDFVSTRRAQVDQVRMATAQERPGTLPMRAVRCRDRNRTLHPTASRLWQLRGRVTPHLHVGHCDRRRFFDQRIATQA